jgi:23S rRNA-/tRNA-specific pseudouridylate synthase
MGVVRKIGRKNPSNVFNGVTEYERVRSFKNFTLVRIKLDSAFTHQIRVHMSALGHPLAGDKLYGGIPLKGMGHLLHAETVSFSHPFTARKTQIFCDMPSAMKELMEKID